MSGKNRRTGPDRLRDRARALIERGLSRYDQGETEAAIVDWRHALALDPHADEAREYIERAQAGEDLDGPREHTDASEHAIPMDAIDDHSGELDVALDDLADMLGSSPALPIPESNGTDNRSKTGPMRVPFAAELPRRRARASSVPRLRRSPTSPSKRTVLGPPMPSERLAAYHAGHGDPTTEDMDVDEEQTTSPSAGIPGVTEVADSDADATLPISIEPDPAMHAVVEPVEGPDTEPIEQRRPQEQHVSLAPTVEIPRAEAERLSRSLLDWAEGDDPGALEPDLAQTMHPGADRDSGPLPPVVIEDVEESDGYEDAVAHAGISPGGQGEPLQPRTRTAQLYGAMPQVPTRSRAGISSTVSQVSAAEPAASAPPASLRPDDPVAQILLERLEHEMPAGESAVEGQVQWLIERAQFEYVGGDYETAVTAAELAFEAAVDSDDCQDLLERHGESLIEMYEAYEGDPFAVPSLAMSPSEYGKRSLDSRAAFLLSRVDGMLTIDDLLAVAGMPALETHRHLCNLLRQGILTLR